jgi:hypothetical protein
LWFEFRGWQLLSNNPLPTELVLHHAQYLKQNLIKRSPSRYGLAKLERRAYGIQQVTGRNLAKDPA